MFLNLKLLVHLSPGTWSLTTSHPSLTNFLLWSLVAEYQAASVITAQNFIKTIEHQQLSKTTPSPPNKKQLNGYDLYSDTIPKESDIFHPMYLIITFVFEAPE